MLENIYNQTVTLFNKLKRTDSLTNKDIWYKTQLTNCAWYRKVERDVASNGVLIGSYITVLIPFNKQYLQYDAWKQLNMQSEHYTMSMGDYIVLGTVDEEVNASNIVKVMESYGDKVCLVKHCNEVYERFGANIQLKIQGV